MIGVAALATVLAFGAVACEDDEDDGGDAPPPQSRRKHPQDAGHANRTAASGESIEVTISEVEGSGVTGSATLTPSASGGFDSGSDG